MKKVILRHIFINGYASVFVSLGLETLAIGLCVEHGDDEEAVARTVGVIAGTSFGALGKYGDEIVEMSADYSNYFLESVARYNDDFADVFSIHLKKPVTQQSSKVEKAVSDAVKKWGILDDGTNQGVKHFGDYWEQYPERIPSLEQRLGVQEGAFNNSQDGFNNFTTQAERVICEATSTGNVRNVNGKMIYYIDGVSNPKKGVVVIVRDGKIQSMMPSDLKSFNKMN